MNDKVDHIKNEKNLIYAHIRRNMSYDNTMILKR